MGLLGLTLGVSFLNLGSLNFPLSMLIAVMKLALVVYYFMELKTHAGMQRVAAFAGVFWLIILFTLVSSDYISRGWMRYPAPWPAQIAPAIQFDR
jgi:cytochrome c oxidase subunit 4